MVDLSVRGWQSRSQSVRDALRVALVIAMYLIASYLERDRAS